MVPRPAMSMLLNARAHAVDQSYRIIAPEWLWNTCCKSHAVSRTPARNFTSSFLRLFDSNFHVPSQMKTPQPVECTLMVARVTVGDVSSNQYDHISWCGALGCVYCGFMRCEPRISVIVTLRRIFTS